MSAVPFDAEERVRWRRDPAVYDAMERLHDAFDEIREAMDDRLNLTGMLLDGVTTPERFAAARDRLEAAESEWAAAVASADALLHQRQEGGE